MALETYVLERGEIFPGLQSIREWVGKQNPTDFQGDFEIKRHSRKFMVFRPPHEQSLELKLLIGEVVQKVKKGNREEDSYFHREMAVFGHRKFQGFVQAGGGRMTLSYSEVWKRWKLHFADRSMDLGVFDPRLMFYGIQLVRELQAEVSFSWQDTFALR